MLSRQAAVLQKMKDGAVLKNWRSDNTSFRKSMEKAARRSEDDVPFAIEDYFHWTGQETGMKLKSQGEKSAFVDMNRKIEELFESLNQLQIAKSSGSLSPRSEQKMLTKEIEQISRLQEEVESLKKYNDMSATVFQYPKIKHHYK